MSSSANHGPYHQCVCYNHDTELPDYKHDVSNPRTLQGYYAVKGGCPCPAKHANGECPGSLYCSKKGGDGSTRPKETFRAADGPHTVHVASPDDGGRDAVTTVRLAFPNSRNYGGTVAERGPTTLSSTAQLGLSKKSRVAERREERAQDRKQFLRAVLRDEMLARMDAEAKRDALESDLDLMGTNHEVEYRTITELSDPRNGQSVSMKMITRNPNEVPPIGEQYAEIMDELDYVSGQPVGSKYNIIRLHYLVEEELRLNNLRRLEKIKNSTISKK